MRRILVLGSGKIGASIVKLLLYSGDYEITVADISEECLGHLPSHEHLTKIKLNIEKERERLEQIAEGKHAIVSALSFYHNTIIAEVCAKTGASYFDLTEDVETTKNIREIARNCAKDGQIFMPQCGLAPGFIGIVGNDIAMRLDEVHTLQMRVGALPMYPTNMLKYNLTWSTDGLINEYCNTCEAIHEGEYKGVLPLEGLEHFSVDGVRYEAFNTSGGLGTLCETWAGKVQNLNYKTVRYLGHRDLCKFLLSELKLNTKVRRRILKEVLEASIPMTLQDVVVIFATVMGKKDGRLVQISDARKVYNSIVANEHWSAIQLTTAAGICTAIDLHFASKLPSKGFVSQETIRLRDFLLNRFGKYYKVDNDMNINVKPVDVFLEEN
ncbi:MAG TPA: saccharopine dehydrogenase NADP-binding domain-containing protein [Oligoflexia bacterium]|nr:saccharopine dehydrogenase NADP-binding domain-containing protein [Oligoflexia bacterium]HMP48098.1 saccharopine dehydrogenase NADP-binding domain-containing protein [Oligoflexia bacterium]